MSGPYVAVSGGFDPIHVGHLRYLRAAKELASTRGLGLMVVAAMTLSTNGILYLSLSSAPVTAISGLS